MIELNIEGIKFTIETKVALYKHETNNFLKELPGIKNNIKFSKALVILNRWTKSMENFYKKFSLKKIFSFQIIL